MKDFIFLVIIVDGQKIGVEGFINPTLYHRIEEMVSGLPQGRYNVNVLTREVKKLKGA